MKVEWAIGHLLLETFWEIFGPNRDVIFTQDFDLQTLGRHL